MPFDNVVSLLVAAGLLLLVAGVIGGGFKLKDITMPTLRPNSRAMAVIVGIILLGVGLVPRPDPDISGTGPGSDEEGGTVPEVVAVPRLTGLHEAAAEDSLARLQLSGQVEQVRAWVPAGEVVRQEPSEGEEVAPGTQVRLFIAGAPYEFRSRRTLVTPDGDTMVGEADYSIRLIPSSQGDTVAEFILQRAEGRPDEGGDLADILRRLVGNPGHLPLSSLQDFDLGRDWQPLSQLAGDIETAMLEATIGQSVDPSSLGPALGMVLIASQLNFDMRTILTTVPPSIADGNVVELQAGTQLISSIRLGGPGRSIHIGSEPHRAFDIVRRAVDQDVQTVGTASYRSDNGLLSTFDMRYTFPQAGAYRLVLQQR